LAVVTNHPHVALALQTLQGLLTPVIGLTTLYIAWQQWQGNKLKLVLDRYDRRMRVYQNVVSMVSVSTGGSKPEVAALVNFRAATAEADFLFGSEIPKYLDELFNRGMLLRKAHGEYRDITQPHKPGYDHEKVVREMDEQQVWFDKQHEVAKQKFKKYLDISR
jgi:hypothetical protein